MQNQECCETPQTRASGIKRGTSYNYLLLRINNNLSWHTLTPRLSKAPSAPSLLILYRVMIASIVQIFFWSWLQGVLWEGAALPPHRIFSSLLGKSTWFYYILFFLILSMHGWILGNDTGSLWANTTSTNTCSSLSLRNEAVAAGWADSQGQPEAIYCDSNPMYPKHFFPIGDKWSNPDLDVMLSLLSLLRLFSFQVWSIPVKTLFMYFFSLQMTVMGLFQIRLYIFYNCFPMFSRTFQTMYSSESCALTPRGWSRA